MNSSNFEDLASFIKKNTSIDTVEGTLSEDDISEHNACKDPIIEFYRTQYHCKNYYSVNLQQTDHQDNLSQVPVDYDDDRSRSRLNFKTGKLINLNIDQKSEKSKISKKDNAESYQSRPPINDPIIRIYQLELEKKEREKD